jgi:hypothetical protein
MKTELLAIVMRVWAGLHAQADRGIAEAIATAVDAAPVFDRELLAATMAVYSWRESGNTMHPEAHSWDASAGVSCGVWQEPCRVIRWWNAEQQARYWIRSVLSAGLASVDSDSARAAKRVRVATKLMAK